MVSRRLGKSHRWLRWVFQTSRSIWTVDSVSGRIRSLFRLPMTRRTICLESDRGDGERDRLVDPQAISVDEGKAAAKDVLSAGWRSGRRQSSSLRTSGNRCWVSLRTFFVNRGQSYPSV